MSAYMVADETINRVVEWLSFEVVLVANSLSVLKIFRVRAQNEVRFCIRHQYHCGDEPSNRTVR